MRAVRISNLFFCPKQIWQMLQGKLWCNWKQKIIFWIVVVVVVDDDDDSKLILKKFELIIIIIIRHLLSELYKTGHIPKTFFTQKNKKLCAAILFCISISFSPFWIFFMFWCLLSYTYKLGCINSMAVGVHTPLISLSINLVNPAPLPFNVPISIIIIYAFGYNLAACVTPSCTFLHLK